MRLTFLGTGTSFGVPQIGCGCAVCHSPDPRDRRTRVGALVETDAGARLLIDTPPELRLQLVAAGVDDLHAVLYTHDHADHIHGIDDLRAFTARRPGPLTVYASAATAASLARKFPYIFDDSLKALPGTFKPEGRLCTLDEQVTVAIGGIDVTPVRVPHGLAEVFAFRIGPLAYVTDAKSIPPTRSRRCAARACWWSTRSSRPRTRRTSASPRRSTSRRPSPLGEKNFIRLRPASSAGWAFRREATKNAPNVATISAANSARASVVTGR